MSILKPTSFENLNYDVIESIVKYLKDPRDIISLYMVNKNLFKTALAKTIKSVEIESTHRKYKNAYFTHKLFKILPLLECVDVWININNLDDIKYIYKNYTNIKYVKFYFTDIDTSLEDISVYVRNIGLLNNTSCKLCKYLSYSNTETTIWIDNNKFSHNMYENSKYLNIHRNYLEHILIEGISVLSQDYVENIRRIPNLKEISYTECGYLPCTSLQLNRMINSNLFFEKLECIPCTYYYDTDLYPKIKEIDYFTYHLMNSNKIYNNIKTLSLPFYSYYIEDIADVFPNLEEIGVRYIYYVDASAIIRNNNNIHNNNNNNNNRVGNDLVDNNNIDIFLDVSEGSEMRTIMNLSKIYRLNVYMYVIFNCVKAKQMVNRNADMKRKITMNLVGKIEYYLPNSKIYSDFHNIFELGKTKDMWLLNNLNRK